MIFCNCCPEGLLEIKVSAKTAKFMVWKVNRLKIVNDNKRSEWTMGVGESKNCTSSLPVLMFYGRIPSGNVYPGRLGASNKSRLVGDLKLIL